MFLPQEFKICPCNAAVIINICKLRRGYSGMFGPPKCMIFLVFYPITAYVTLIFQHTKFHGMKCLICICIEACVLVAKSNRRDKQLAELRFFPRSFTAKH